MRYRRALYPPSIAVVLCLMIPVLPLSAGEEDLFVGHWEGEIVYAAAGNETDIFVDLTREKDGFWSGTLELPINSSRRVLQNIKVEGRTISFGYSVPDGGVRSYRGTLQSDGDTITGDYARGDQNFPFELLRQRQRKTPPPRPELRDLFQEYARELKELFNHDVGNVRLIVLTAPSSEMGNTRARMLQKYVLNTIPDMNLRVYVLWVPILETDNRKVAESATIHLPDSRVTHFWTNDLSVANAFKQPLGIRDETPWDVFLLYSAKARWGDSFPVPDSYRHLLTELPPNRQFDIFKLAAEINALLHPE